MLSKVLGGVIVIMFVIGSIQFGIMSSKIKSQEAELETLKNSKVVLEVDLQTEKSNVNLLRKTVDELNKEIEKMEVRNQKTLKAYNDYIKKSNEEKYNQATQDIINKTNWSKATCQDVIELNKMISELKYEDL